MAENSKSLRVGKAFCKGRADVTTGQTEPCSTAYAHPFGETPREGSSWRVRLADGGHVWIQERRDADGVEMPAEGRLVFRAHYTRVSSSVTSTFMGGSGVVSWRPGGSWLCWGWSSTQAVPERPVPGSEHLGPMSHVLCQVLNVRTQGKR